MEYNITLPEKSILDSGVRKYRIVKVLGQGGFGITYKAIGKVKIGNIEMTVPFAIKEHFIKQFNERKGNSVTIPNSSNVEEVNESIGAFLTEAQRLNRLSLEHPGIVKVNENFRANDTAYYVMEYVEGESLRHHVERHAGGCLSETEAVALIRQVGESIQYLHDHRLTHLDIKPDNILLRDNGQPVLIDFGLSKHYDKKGRATSTLKVLGTSDGYSPLEQYAGITEFSPKADVYALAATLLFMLSGKDPAKAIGISPATITSQLQDKDVGRPVVDAILSAMGKLPDERTASVADFLGMLTGEEYSAAPKVEPGTDASKTELIRNRSGIKGVVTSFSSCRLLNFSLKRLLAVVGVVAIVSAMAYLLDTVINHDDYVHLSNIGVESFTVNDVSFNMVRVEGGTFWMGSDDSVVYSNEKPVHEVKLSSYYIGETEVTQDLWEAVMGSNPSEFKGTKRPVENVSWEDCQNFIRKLNEKTGRLFRLPTEAEWEYAARGGAKSGGFKYSGGNDLGRVAWYSENSDYKTHPVGQKQPNELGLYDMSGNVLEWCEDWYDEDYYSNSPQENPTGPSHGARRVLRGSSWRNDARISRFSLRESGTPSERLSFFGLRLTMLTDSLSAKDATELEAVKVTFESDDLFDAGASTLTSAGKASLSDFANILKLNTDCDIHVRAYTDNANWKNSTREQSAQKNRDLSQKRAMAVTTYLQSIGVSSSQIRSTIGYGEDSPVADNSTIEGRKKNHRVEIFLTASEELKRKAMEDTEVRKTEDSDEVSSIVGGKE